MIPTFGTKISGYFFSLIFPFFTPLTIAEDLSLVKIALFLSVIVLESYIVHRMLKKPCTFVVPRMFVINFISMWVEGLVFACLAFIFWLGMFSYVGATYSAMSELPKNIKDFSPDQFEKAIAYPLALLGSIGAIILFYVRWKVFCKMYVWFDKAVNQTSVRKIMLYVVSVSYFFWFFVMWIDRLLKLNW